MTRLTRMINDEGIPKLQIITVSDQTNAPFQRRSDWDELDNTGI